MSHADMINGILIIGAWISGFAAGAFAVLLIEKVKRK